MPPPASRGALGGLHRLLLDGKEYLHLLPVPTDRTAHPKAQPVCTLLLRAPNRAASDELAAAVTCALSALGSALGQRRPRLLPGGGCIEVLLARLLRDDAARLGKQRAAAEASLDAASRRARQQALPHYSMATSASRTVLQYGY